MLLTEIFPVHYYCTLKVDQIIIFLVFVLNFILIPPGISQKFKCDIHTSESHSGGPSRPSESPKTDCVDISNTKIINVNIHFLQRSNGTGNYTEVEGLSQNGYNGYAMANELIETSNWLFGNNPQMFQPIGNETPSLPVNIQLKLKGIYFLPDDTAFETNISNFWSNLPPFLQNPDTEINIFITPQNIGSSGLAGLGLSGYNYTLIAGFGGYENENNIDHPDPEVPFRLKAFTFADVINHEVGHILSLRHPFKVEDGNDCVSSDEDNCPDTYTFCAGDNNDNDGDTGNNCYHPLFPLTSAFSGESCQPEEYSNTFMDYNGNHKSISPCQIEKMHTELCTEGENYFTSCSLPNFFLFNDANPIPGGTTHASGSIWASSSAPNSGADLHAALLVKLQAGFSIPAGSEVNIGIRDCTGNAPGIDIEEGEVNKRGAKSDDLTLHTKNISIFPNPTESQFQVKFDSQVQAVLIEIYDLTGRLVLSRANVNTPLNTLKLSNPGMYFILVKDQRTKQKLYSEKLILR